MYAENTALSGNPTNLVFWTNSAGTPAERMRITSGGDVRINFNPGAANGLYFNDATSSAAMLYIIPAIYTGSAPYNSNRIVAANSSNLSFEVGGAERMRITSTGRVMIGGSSGTLDPVWQGMSVHGVDGTDKVIIGYLSSSTNGAVIAAHISGLDNWANLNYEANSHIFRYQQSEIFRTTSGGVVQVQSGGVETQFGGGYKFWNDAQSRWWLMYTYSAASNQLRFNYFGSDVGSINPSSGAYTALSDINKKKDFEYSNIGLNEVMGLKPTLYRMKSDESEGSKELGFIAQEVKEFIPQAYVENGEDAAKFIGLNYNAIVAALVKGMQEQQSQIESLKAEIQTLKQ
jgi:hypothetical protein